MTTVVREHKRETRKRRSRAAAERASTGTRSRGAGGRGIPSAQAVAAGQAFSELQDLFATKTALAEALGWSLPTVHQWCGSVPTRPRQKSVREVVQLRDLAAAAREWVSDPLEVGDWLLAPLPELRGSVPARLAVDLPREGLELLIGDMALIAPKQRVTPQSAEMSVELLRQTLTELKVRAIAPLQAGAQVDLSDFD